MCFPQWPSAEAERQRPKQQDGGDCCAGQVWCQVKTAQDMVGWLQPVDFRAATAGTTNERLLHRLHPFVKNDFGRPN